MLVTGSTGNNGGALVGELTSLGASVQVMAGAGLSGWLEEDIVKLDREVYGPGCGSKVGAVAEATGGGTRSVG